MPLAVFEPAIPANERPQSYALERAASGASTDLFTGPKILLIESKSNED
jgi:hypothetical protein